MKDEACCLACVSKGQRLLQIYFQQVFCHGADYLGWLVRGLR
jgi:hypothetical protein